MKRIIGLLFCFCISSISMGASFWISLEVNQENLFPIQDAEYLKTLVPWASDLLNEMIFAQKEGKTVWYDFEIEVESWDEKIISAQFYKPGDPVPVAMKREGNNEFYFDSDEMTPVRIYTSLDELSADFPAGTYVVEIVFKSGTITQEVIVPDYSTVTFPVFPDISLEEEASGQLLFNWNTVADVDDYEIWAESIKSGRFFDAYEEEVFPDDPGAYSTPLGLYKAKGDYQIGLFWENQVDCQDNYCVEFNTDVTLFSFRKPAPVFENKVTKCTVTAGANNADSISLTGQLQAVEADFLYASEAVVTLESDALPDPITFTFSVNAATLKKGKFSAVINDLGVSSSLKYDTKTHALLFSSKKIDLTGLGCPITVDITIGDYFSAQIELDEDIVNGTKPCPPELLMGVQDNLTITSSSLKPGKTYSLDILTVQGSFTYSGDPMDVASDFIVRLAGTQDFTVPGGWFTEKKGVFTCTNAPANEGGLVSAKLDANKGLYTITIKYVSIEYFGLVDFDLLALGKTLSGYAQIDLGTAYTCWQLTQYDQPAASWRYNTGLGVGAATVTVNAQGGDEYEIYENEMDAWAYLYYSKEADDSAVFTGMEIESDDLGGDISLNFNLQMWPAFLRPGQTWSWNSPMSGSMSGAGYTLDIVNGNVQAQTSISPSLSKVKVPAGTYDNTVRFDEIWTMTGEIEYGGEIAGTIKFVFTQTNYAVPGYGIVKRTRKFSISARIPGSGSISDRISETYLLTEE
jgi:hypothetical protein